MRSRRTLGFGRRGRPQNELSIPLLFPPVDEQPEEEQKSADLDDVFKRLDRLIEDHIRDEQVSLPVVDLLDPNAAEEMPVTEDEDERSTDDELFAPVEQPRLLVRPIQIHRPQIEYMREVFRLGEEFLGNAAITLHINPRVENQYLVNSDDEEMPEEFSSDQEMSETFSPDVTSDEDL